MELIRIDSNEIIKSNRYVSKTNNMELKWLNLIDMFQKLIIWNEIDIEYGIEIMKSNRYVSKTNNMELKLIYIRNKTWNKILFSL